MSYNFDPPEPPYEEVEEVTKECAECGETESKMHKHGEFRDEIYFLCDECYKIENDLEDYHE